MTDSSVTLWIAIVAGVPATLAAVGNLFVILRTKAIAINVEKIEKQTNSMNSQMVQSAEIKGELLGKIKAEAVAASAAASLAATPAMSASPSLPILIQPASSDAEIIRWIQQGIAIEKARRDAQGNGPSKAP